MRRILIALAVGALTLTACGTDTDPEATPPDGADDAAAFPVTVTDDRGVELTLDAAPERIVSLSATHTEILFAIDAGDQVVAVDDQSNFPPEAPVTDLSGFEPNLEAIASQEPDLVIIAFDPGDLASGLEELDIPVLQLNPATSLEDAYDQWELVGEATGHGEAATALATATDERIDELVAGVPTLDEPLTYFHELDENLFTATSSTFIGDVYGRFPLENIADAADEAGSGFPQLSAEYVIESDPDLIFLADAVYGQTPDVVAARPGWDTIEAVAAGNLVEVDPDLASRWGPRVVDFVELVAEAVGAAATT